MSLSILQAVVMAHKLASRPNNFCETHGMFRLEIKGTEPTRGFCKVKQAVSSCAEFLATVIPTYTVSRTSRYDPSCVEHCTTID